MGSWEGKTEVMMVCNFNFGLYLESSEALERTEGKDRRIRGNSNSGHRESC